VVVEGTGYEIYVDQVEKCQKAFFAVLGRCTRDVYANCSTDTLFICVSGVRMVNSLRCLEEGAAHSTTVQRICISHVIGINWDCLEIFRTSCGRRSQFVRNSVSKVKSCVIL
jgi:hypothetical protein